MDFPSKKFTLRFLHVERARRTPDDENSRERKICWLLSWSVTLQLQRVWGCVNSCDSFLIYLQHLNLHKHQVEYRDRKIQKSLTLSYRSFNHYLGSVHPSWPSISVFLSWVGLIKGWSRSLAGGGCRFWHVVVSGGFWEVEWGKRKQ